MDLLSPFHGSADYKKNEARVREPKQACACCGKPVDPDAPATHHVDVRDGGSHYQMKDQPFPPADDRGWMGGFPVGRDCAKRLAAAGVLVTRNDGKVL